MGTKEEKLFLWQRHAYLAYYFVRIIPLGQTKPTFRHLQRSFSSSAYNFSVRFFCVIETHLLYTSVSGFLNNDKQGRRILFPIHWRTGLVNSLARNIINNSLDKRYTTVGCVCVDTNKSNWPDTICFRWKADRWATKAWWICFAT